MKNNNDFKLSLMFFISIEVRFKVYYLHQSQL